MTQKTYQDLLWEVFLFLKKDYRFGENNAEEALIVKGLSSGLTPCRTFPISIQMPSTGSYRSFTIKMGAGLYRDVDKVVLYLFDTPSPHTEKRNTIVFSVQAGKVESVPVLNPLKPKYINCILPRVREKNMVQVKRLTSKSGESFLGIANFFLPITIIQAEITRLIRTGDYLLEEEVDETVIKKLPPFKESDFGTAHNPNRKESSFVF